MLSGARLLASLLFFATGALGLGYQLIWIKKAALIVGGSQLALSTVVTSFFMGLALGSLFVGRHLRSRRWSPLVVYAGFEVGVGLYALAFPATFGLVESAYGALFPLFADRAAALFAMRFGLLFLFFLAPTFLMGGTLPLLLDGLVERDRSVGSLTSLLYGLNVAGAVVGVLVTGYWAVPTLGMNGTSGVAGLCNLAIGAIAFVAFRNLPPLHPMPDPSDGSAGPEGARTAAEAGPGAVFVALSFLSGFAALGYQIAWARYFGLFTQSSVYFTAVLLAVYLAALAAGSIALSALLRQGQPPLRVLGWTQPLAPMLVFGLLTAWTVGSFEYAPAGDRPTYVVLPSWLFWSETVDAIFLAPVLQVALTLFAPVMLLGAGLPALIAAATRSSAALRSVSGSLVFWNTVGSSAGGFAAGYLLIPGLGLGLTFACLAMVSIAIGACCQWLRWCELGPESTGGLGRRVPGALLLAVAVLVSVGSLGRDVVHEALMVHGPGRPSRPDETVRLVDLVEGPTTTAWVLERSWGRVIGSGAVQLAISTEGISYQAVQGSIGPLFYPRAGAPERVLGIAMGSGQTFGGLLLHPIGSLDVVDISGEIVGLSLKHFEALQHGLGSDPRVRIHLDDGRHFVARAESGSYDLVTSEPPPPTDAGVHVLYSLEFYEEVRRILRPGGMLQSWLPVYRLTPDDVRGMLKTQAAVFPQTFLIKYGSEAFSIVSFKLEEPPLFRREWLEDRIRLFARERHVAGYRWPGPPARYSLDSVEGVAALLITGPEDIEAIDFPLIHREDDERLGYSSGDRELLRRYQDLRWLSRLAFTAVPITPMESLQRYFDWELPIGAIEEDRAAGLHAVFGVPSPRELREATLRWEQGDDRAARAELALRIASLHDARLDKARAFEWVGRAIADGAGDAGQVARARRIARHGIALEPEALRDWLDSLTPDAQRSLVAVAMRAVLRNHDAWESKRRSRYWLE